jgi:hypothetical protein
MTAPLKSQRGSEPGKVTTGYGPGGGFAFEFTVPPGQTSDTGFLKLFVSTTPVSLDWITQNSLLDGNFTPRQGRSVTLDSECWDAWVAAVTVVEKGPT